jgi:hypothetical protein
MWSVICLPENGRQFFDIQFPTQVHGWRGIEHRIRSRSRRVSYRIRLGNGATGGLTHDSRTVVFWRELAGSRRGAGLCILLRRVSGAARAEGCVLQALRELSEPSHIERTADAASGAGVCRLQVGTMRRLWWSLGSCWREDRCVEGR